MFQKFNLDKKPAFFIYLELLLARNDVMWWKWLNALNVTIGNVNLYIRQAEFDTQIPEFDTQILEFDTQIPEFDTWIRQESKLAPLSNI